MKIDEAIQLFTAYVTAEKRLAAGTVSYYVGEVERFGQYLKSQQIEDIEDIDTRDIRAWQMGLLEAGDAPGTVTKKLAALRAWFKYLRRQKLLNKDVMAPVKPPKAPKRLPVFFRESEVERIYGDIYPHTYDGEVHRIVLRILYETGMRRTELSALTLSGIDLGALTIKVRGKRNKERFIPIEPELAAGLKRYIELREAQLDSLRDIAACRAMTDRLLVNSTGRPLSAGMIYIIVKRYMPSLSDAERTSPHVFRHTFATHMLNEGANIDAIKELLGHSSLAATEVYTHVTREHLKESYKHAHPRANKK